MHIVLNYIGPNVGQGIILYNNGEEWRSDTNKYGGTYSAGDGKIVVGREYTTIDDSYTSMQIDELIYFNQALSDDEIQLIYNASSVIGN